MEVIWYKKKYLVDKIKWLSFTNDTSIYKINTHYILMKNKLFHFKQHYMSTFYHNDFNFYVILKRHFLQRNNT